MHTLEQFVQLPENRSAYQAVVRFAGAGEVPLLLLHGSPGSGKSHLVRALIEQVTQADATKTALVLAAAEVGRALMQPPLERRAVSRDAIHCDLLVVEDIQHLQPGAGDDIAHILDRRLARRRATVITASRGPAELELSPRLASRLVGGLIVGIQPLGEASRLELAAALCRERRLSVTDDVIAWLGRDPGGARPILGGIAQLEALARLHPPPLTIAVVQAEVPAASIDHTPFDRLLAPWPLGMESTPDLFAVRRDSSALSGHARWPCMLPARPVTLFRRSAIISAVATTQRSCTAAKKWRGPSKRISAWPKRFAICVQPFNNANPLKLKTGGFRAEQSAA